MSQHHRRQKWSTHSPKLRATIQQLLPQRCLDCPCPVTPDQKWQVGHRQAAALGGQPTLANAGPSHVYCQRCRKSCNQSSGGKLGAAKTNARRRRAAQPDLRDWT